jgi:hypothetical protein
VRKGACGRVNEIDRCEKGCLWASEWNGIDKCEKGCLWARVSALCCVACFLYLHIHYEEGAAARHDQGRGSV